MTGILYEHLERPPSVALRRFLVHLNYARSGENHEVVSCKAYFSLIFHSRAFAKINTNLDLSLLKMILGAIPPAVAWTDAMTDLQWDYSSAGRMTQH